MMLRVILISLLVVFLVRALWRVFEGVIEGVTGQRMSGPRTPARSVQMVRDPVCGTFILPDRAVRLVEGGREVHFCSTGCRDKYRARTA
jgi:YHS domain-containing protein